MIIIKDVTKRYGDLTALDHLSFSVAAGEAVALWGANGAGKTTALRCLLNLIPFKGDISVDGWDVKRHGKAVRRLIGFVPQELSFHDDMTVTETLFFYARLKKVSANHDFAPLLERLELTPHIDKQIRNLSGGLKQRLALALALLADPPLLVLDEPTASLDIRAREDFLHLLDELKLSGKTFVFSSHRLDEVISLADRVLLMEAGKLIVDAPPSELGHRLGWSATLHLYMAEPRITPAVEALSARGLPVSRNGRGVRVQVQPGEKSKVLNMLHDAGIVVDDFTVE